MDNSNSDGKHMFWCLRVITLWLSPVCSDTLNMWRFSSLAWWQNKSEQV